MDSAIVTRDPEIMSGALCFAGTRVPVKNLFDYLEGSSSLEEFLENFPSVSRERAVAVLEAARESLAAIAEVDAAWEVDSAAESKLFLKVVAVNALKAPQAHQAFQLPAALRLPNGWPREAHTGRLVRSDQLRRQPDPARTGRSLISAPCPHHARRICVRSARSPDLAHR